MGNSALISSCLPLCIRLDLSVIQSKEHQLLALESSEKSFVLLKNRENLLPLKTVPQKIAVRPLGITR